jgi:hypothetical protein
MTWRAFLVRYKDDIPASRIVLAKRRQYADEMRTSLVVQPDFVAEDVFPRKEYERRMIIDCMVDEDDRIVDLLDRLSACKKRLDRVALRLDACERILDQRQASRQANDC